MYIYDYVKRCPGYLTRPKATHLTSIKSLQVPSAFEANIYYTYRVSLINMELLMSSYTFFSNITKEIPDIPANSIVSQTIHKSPQQQTILFAFAAGQELSEHSTAQTATLHFMQGEAEITLGDEVLTAQAGSWVYMPPHLPHSIMAKTTVLMLLTMVKTPDQLKIRGQ